jgi:transcriptional/translational regulatory protein YebC/TACO1
VASRREGAGLKLGEQRWNFFPQNTVKLEGENAKKMLKLMDALEDNDDVQNVYANFEIDEALMDALQG